jgi:hypothetical protein
MSGQFPQVIQLEEAPAQNSLIRMVAGGGGGISVHKNGL